jgi:hypothetical protein
VVSSFLIFQPKWFIACVIFRNLLFCSGKESAATCSRWFVARRYLYPEDGDSTFLRNLGLHKMYTAPHPRRRHSS